jgi:hypothetical protein
MILRGTDHPDDSPILQQVAGFDADQQALVEIAKQARRNGVSMDQALILQMWAIELRMKGRIDGPHGGYGVHLHIGPIGHIPIH